MIEENMVVQVDGEGATLYLVTDIWNSTIKTASLVNLDTFEVSSNEALINLHPAGWSAEQILKLRKSEFEERIARIDRLLLHRP